MIVIADTTPVNYLVLIQKIDLLPRLFGRVLIPPAVFEQLKDPETPTPVRTWLADAPSWLQVQPVGRGRLKGALAGTAGTSSKLRFHQICEDIVYSRQVAFAFRLQLLDNPRIEAHAHWHLPPYIPQPHHACQLLIG